MLWGANEQGNTRWENPRYSTNQTVTPLAQQMNDANSCFAFYKKLIATRNANPILSNGGVNLEVP